MHVFLQVRLKVCNKQQINILSYGINHYVPKNDNSIHAEHHALNNLPYYKRQKKLKNINILILRVSKTKKITMSKPCVNCIKKLKFLPSKKGYKIQNIYYSDENGGICQIKLSNI